MNEQRASYKNDISLCEQMRPLCFENFVGQKEVIGPNKILQQLLTNGYIHNMILWGPPGCGKTSLANIISKLSKKIYTDKVHTVELSATSCGINDIRNIVNSAKTELKLKKQTIVILDKIHRFNKLQQDIFLPHIEAGTFTLIGTTTENPSYSVNPALLSRCRIFALNKLTVEDIVKILFSAIPFINGKICDSQKENFVQSEMNFNAQPCFSIDKAVLEWLAEVSDGDARVALYALETAVKIKVYNIPRSNYLVSITIEDVKQSLKQAYKNCDIQSNNTHHMYSALHKSIKADKGNAALYWLARIMAIKEDPIDIARRLVRIASEDVGLADPDALGVAVHTMHGCQMIGMPECDVLLAQCVMYLIRAPKSSFVYNALQSAKNAIINNNGMQSPISLYVKESL